MGLILYKGSSTNLDHYTLMVKVGDICFGCDDVKITKIKFNNFCNSDTVYLLQKKHMIKTFKGHLASPNGSCRLSELRRRHQNSIMNRFLNCLLSFTFVTFLIN